MANKIKKGDEVVVITGKDKGKIGKVLQVLPKTNKILVSGCNNTYKLKQTFDLIKTNNKIIFIYYNP